MRSPSTRYGLIGVSLDSIQGRNFAMNACLAVRISSTSAGFLATPPRLLSSSLRACRVSLASPITA